VPVWESVRTTVTSTWSPSARPEVISVEVPTVSPTFTSVLTVLSPAPAWLTTDFPSTVRTAALGAVSTLARRS